MHSYTSTSKRPITLLISAWLAALIGVAPNEAAAVGVIQGLTTLPLTPGESPTLWVLGTFKAHPTATPLDISGKVTFSEYLIDSSGLAGVDPIPAARATDRERQDGSGAAMIQTIDTSPGEIRGMRLGSFVAYQLALHAERRGLDYVIAADIVERARSFYYRLGFQEYEEQAGYRILLQRRRDIQQALVDPDREDERERLSVELVEVTDRLAHNKLFISTGRLKEEAQRLWNERWDRQEDGTYLERAP